MFGARKRLIIQESEIALNKFNVPFEGNQYVKQKKMTIAGYGRHYPDVPVDEENRLLYKTEVITNENYLCQRRLDRLNLGDEKFKLDE